MFLKFNVSNTRKPGLFCTSYSYSSKYLFLFVCMLTPYRRKPGFSSLKPLCFVHCLIHGTSNFLISNHTLQECLTKNGADLRSSQGGFESLAFSRKRHWDVEGKPWDDWDMILMRFISSETWLLLWYVGRWHL